MAATIDDFPELFEAYRRTSSIMSFAHMMRKVPEYAEIMSLGEAAVPLLLGALRDDPSMAVQTLLLDLTGHWPSAATEAVAPGFVGIKVHESAELWRSWGRAQGYVFD
jgi:hypothetical protein